MKTIKLHLIRTNEMELRPYYMLFFVFLKQQEHLFIFPWDRYYRLHMARAAWIDVLCWFFEPYVYGNMSMVFGCF